MAFQVSPGVNVSEIDLTTVVPAVSTTEGAIAAHLRWGPVEELVLVDTEYKLVNIFNKPNANNATDFFTAANFLTYGNSLYVVRAVDNLTAKNAGSGTVGVALIKNKEKYDEEFNTANKPDWVAKYAGDLGNSLKVESCTSANAWEQSFSTNSTNTAGRMLSTANVSFTFTAGSNTVTVAYGGNTAHVGDTVMNQFNLGDVLLSSNNVVLGTVKKKVSNTSIQLEGFYTAFTDGGTANLKIGDTTSTVAQSAAVLKRRWGYHSTFDQAPSTTAYANNVNSQGDALHVVVVDEDGTITGRKGTVLEAYENVSQASDAKTKKGA